MANLLNLHNLTFYEKIKNNNNVYSDREIQEFLNQAGTLKKLPPKVEPLDVIEKIYLLYYFDRINYAQVEPYISYLDQYMIHYDSFIFKLEKREKNIEKISTVLKLSCSEVMGRALYGDVWNKSTGYDFLDKEMEVDLHLLDDYLYSVSGALYMLLDTSDASSIYDFVGRMVTDAINTSKKTTTKPKSTTPSKPTTTTTTPSKSKLDQLHDRLQRRLDEDTIIDTFEELLREDYGCKYINDVNVVMNHYIVANRDAKIYGKLQNDLLELVDLNCLPITVSKEHRRSMLITAVVFVGVTLFLLFSPFTQFLYSYEARELIVTGGTLIGAVLGFFVGSFIGIFLGAGAVGFILNMIHNLISIATFTKVVIVIIFGACVVGCLMSAFTGTTEQKEKLAKSKEAFSKKYGEMDYYVTTIESGILRYKESGTQDLSEMEKYYEKVRAVMKDMKNGKAK